jgi:ribosomal protein S27AE
MLTLKEVKKLSSIQTQNRKLCKNCGHSKLLGKQERVICGHCGHWIFKDDETEFKYRMKEQRLKEKKKDDSNNNI